MFIELTISDGRKSMFNVNLIANVINLNGSDESKKSRIYINESTFTVQEEYEDVKKMIQESKPGTTKPSWMK